MTNKIPRKTPGTFQERFIRELQRLCDGQDIAISNKILRENLGWLDERFDSTRSELIKKGMVKAAPGQGGKTKFTAAPIAAAEKKNLKLFISYSHTDEDYREQLVKHLMPLHRLGIISSWHDRLIKPGDDFDKKISDNLEDADITIILVSIDFINSKYCYEQELEKAIENHNKNKTRLIPIILRDCMWHHSPFGGIQALPKDGNPVSKYTDKDSAFTAIAKAIHDVANELLQA